MHVVLKNPDEKLVKIDVEFTGEIISAIHISGDFFIYPEESIFAIERVLTGLTANRKLIEQILNELVTSHTIQMVGISVSTIAQGIMEALASNE